MYKDYQSLPLVSKRVVRVTSGSLVLREVRRIDRRVFLSSYLGRALESDVGKLYIRDCDPKTEHLRADYVVKEEGDPIPLSHTRLGAS
jgi:hypothetical protein